VRGLRSAFRGGLSFEEEKVRGRELRPNSNAGTKPASMGPVEMKGKSIMMESERREPRGKQ